MKSVILNKMGRACLLLVLLPVAALAIDTDVVTFKNGDRLTGEIKSLDRGQLKFKTEATGTITIEWENVGFLSSDQNIQTETRSGTRYFGVLVESEEPGKMVVVTSSGPVTLEDEIVVKMTPIEQENWQDWDIDASFGYNFSSASDVQQFNVGASAKHRTLKRIIGASLSSIVSSSADSPASKNDSLAFNFTRLRPNRWTNSADLDFTRNDELGLAVRTSLGAGIGRILTQTNHSMFVLEGGLKLSREDIIDVEEDNTSVESYGQLNWDWFRYDSPEWDLSTEFEVIPSLTDWGRVRADLNITVKWEIIGDFFWTFVFYDSYDSQPTSPDAENHDYGVSTSISYSF